MQIEIMSREEAYRFSFVPHREKIAVISISDCDKDYPNLSNNPNNGILAHFKIHFDDVDMYVGGENCITYDDAGEIASFVRNIVRLRMDRLIVHCEAGISRSAGVAAAIMKGWDGDDSPVFDNPRFRPNMICYRTVLNAVYEKMYLNLDIPGGSLGDLELIDELSEQLGVSCENVMEVRVHLQLANVITSSKHKPIREYPNERFAQRVFHEFSDFITNVQGILGAGGCDEIDYQTSDLCGISHYFTFFPTDKDGNRKPKHLIFLYIPKRYSANPKNPNQHWIFREIDVNSVEYSNYDEAYDVVEQYVRAAGDLHQKGGSQI